MAKHLETDRKRTAEAVAEAPPFRRMLVAIDESSAAQAVLGLVAEWVDGPGADVRVVQVTEQRRHGGEHPEPPVDTMGLKSVHRLVVGARSAGARNRQVVKGVVAAAEDFGADVIVLGFDRPRLSRHPLGPGLCEQVMCATDLPVLVSPSARPDRKHRSGPAPHLHHGEDRAQRERRYAHV